MPTLQTTCPLDCPDLCRLAVTVEAGRVVRVDAAPDTSITDGFICAKVRKLAAHVHGDARVATPLVRRGDTLVTATWEATLDLVGERLERARARHGGEAILPYHYGGSNGWLTEGALASRFFRRLGATRLGRTFCAVQSSAAARGMFGEVPGCALPDYAASRLVMLWGVNPSATGIHLVPLLDDLLARGGELVVVDPRRTPLARRATLHVAPRPGTDLPLALAVVNLLFQRGLADRTFLAAHTRGADELERRAARWSLPEAAAVTDVPAAQIEELTQRWAAASPAVVRLGWGLERNRHGGGATATVLALPVVAGKLGVRGGGFTLHTGDAGWGLSAESAICAPVPQTRELNMNQLGRALDGPTRWDAPPIEVVFVYNCNPASTAPEQLAVRRGLARPDVFTIVHDAVMTDTAALADVVLPATTFLEHREIRRGYGTIRLVDRPAVLSPVGQAWSNNRLFGELLARLGLARPGEPTTDAELADAIFAGPRGGALRAQLDARGHATPWSEPDGPAPILCADEWPTTPDGKIDLVPAALDAEAPGSLHTYTADPGTPAYPLALISPALSTMISSTFGQLRTAEAAAELSPVDAASRGLADGDEVKVWNDLGEVRCAVRVSADVRPGVVVLAKGLWARHTRNGNTSNALIPAALSDLAGGATYNDARVQVARTG